MTKILKRKKISVKDKILKAQSDINNELSLNKENELTKLLNSNLGPIIDSYYITDPVVVSKKVPYNETKFFDKGMKKLRKSLRGTLFNDTEFKAYKDRKFTIEEILEAISIHKLAMSPKYKPVDKKYLRIHLDQFLYNPYASSIGKSFLIYWTHNMPLPVVACNKDSNPEITQEVINRFGWGNLSSYETNYIISGVEKFALILEEFNISPIHRTSFELKALILHEILTKLFSFVGVDFTPSNFNSAKYEGWIRKGLEESPYIL
jgi:hypothetical protein